MKNLFSPFILLKTRCVSYLEACRIKENMVRVMSKKCNDYFICSKGQPFYSLPNTVKLKSKKENTKHRFNPVAL